MNENYYRILGLDNFASEIEIKQAYRRLAKKYHPDKSQGSEEQFKRISVAYKKLSDSSFKAIHDEWLRKPTNYYPTSHSNNPRPAYKKRTRYYTSERTQFTPKVKMYGLLFLILFVFGIGLISIGLMYKSSEYHFNEAEEQLAKGQVGMALRNYERAIKWFGAKTDEACVAAIRTSFFKMNNINQSNYFISLSEKYASKPFYIGEVHYLKGRVSESEQNFNDALKEYSLAKELGFFNDSIGIRVGVIRAFYQEEFEMGISEFDKLLTSNNNNEDALFGKAWCVQKLNKPMKSIGLYNELLKINPNHVLGNFYRGHNLIVLGDTLKACRDFRAAYDLGYQPALIYYSRQCGNSQ